MFFIFYICFLLQSFLAPLNSFAATLDDRRENLLSMLRQPLASLLSQSVTIQEATVRTHTPRKPLPSIDEESPSFDSSPATLEALAEERKSLQPFVEYLYHHIPTVMHSKPDLPPLNSSTVLSAAFEKLPIGPSSCFKSYVFFSPDPTDLTKGHTVLQRAIDFQKKDSGGRTNLERMRQGLAPLGPLNKPVVLHHVTQENDLLAEVTSRTHTKYHGLFHYRLSPHSSRINRANFRAFREKYWRYRASQIPNKHQLSSKKLF